MKKIAGMVYHSNLLMRLIWCGSDTGGLYADLSIAEDSAPDTYDRTSKYTPVVIAKL